MKKISKITGRAYDPGKIITILNLDQADYYINEMGVPLQDLIFTSHKYSGKTNIGFIFEREDTKIPFDRWVRRGEYHEN